MADYLDVAGKLEDALVALASDGGLESYGVCSQGQDFEEMVLPRFTFAASNPVQQPVNTGQWRVKARCVAWTSADKKANETVVKDPKELHRQMAAKLGDLFCQEENSENSLVDWRDSTGTLQPGKLGELIEDFTATGMASGFTWTHGHDGRAFWTALEFEIFCCPVDLEY